MKAVGARLVMGVVLLCVSLLPAGTFMAGCGTVVNAESAKEVGFTVAGHTSSPQTSLTGPVKGKWKYVGLEVKLPSGATASSLRELEAKSLAIVEVVVVDSAANPRNRVVPGGPPLGSTLTRVIVEKVFKSDGHISAGNEYTIVEAYTTMLSKTDPDTTLVVALGNVFPMVKGGRYLLFLQPAFSDYGDYTITGLWQGQYKISQEIKNADSAFTLTKEELGAAQDKDRDPKYWGLAQEVKNKYLGGH